MADNLSLERTGRITGSRIPAILGLSPYRTRADVLREMVREAHWADSEFDGDFITEYGVEHELDGIAEYEMLNGVTVENKGDDQITVVDPNGLFAVTPDGLVSDIAVEVKCPWRALYTHHSQRPDYEAQMHLVCEVTGSEACDFVVWRHEGTNISRMHHDETWLPSVMPEVERFLEEYNRTVESEELSAPHLEGLAGYRYDREWLEASATLLDLLSEQDRINEAVEQAKKEAQALTPERSSRGGGLFVVYSRPRGGGRGQVSYKNALEALVPAEKRTDAILNQFRGSGSGGSSRGTYSFRRLDDDANQKGKS